MFWDPSATIAVAGPPAAGTTKMLDTPSLSASNAIHWLPGDQRGEPQFPISVSFLADVPSEFMVQISTVPERSDIKAIVLPSGETCAPSFRSFAEVTTFRAPAASVCVRSWWDICGVLTAGFVHN